MNSGKKDATPIARLLDGEGAVVGWVYRWNTLELSILWVDRNRDPHLADPPICPEILATAKSVTKDAVTALLDKLSADRRSPTD